MLIDRVYLDHVWQSESSFSRLFFLRYLTAGHVHLAELVRGQAYYTPYKPELLLV